MDPAACGREDKPANEPQFSRMKATQGIGWRAGRLLGNDQTTAPDERPGGGGGEGGGGERLGLLLRPHSDVHELVESKKCAVLAFSAELT